jgi:hypothetical protein
LLNVGELKRGPKLDQESNDPLIKRSIGTDKSRVHKMLMAIGGIGEDEL